MRIQEIKTLDKRVFNPPSSQFTIRADRVEKYKSTMRPLLGGSNYTYVIEKPAGDNVEIIILDPKVLNQDIKNPYIIGAISLFSRQNTPPNTLQVRSIAVHPEYRGHGIAKALYGLSLLPKPDGLGATLLSDFSQTPGGMKNWLNLSKIPGVEVTGLIQIEKISLELLKKMPRIEQSRVNIMSDLLGKVGGFYFDENNYSYFYQIPVEMIGEKLENAVRNSMLKIYPDKDALGYHSYLLAKYVGV